MGDITEFSKEQLIELESELEKKYNECVSLNLKLDMSRGKPSTEQLNITNGILDNLNVYITKDNIDVRNYGVLDGLQEAKELFSDLLEIDIEKIIIGGNSSLNLMYDTIMRLYVFGTQGCTPWRCLESIKFICPSPGYDRHFAICEELGIKMITVPMLKDGPDMDIIESLVASDEAIKGIFCTPLYSNPDGTYYSDEVVERIASMKTSAKDFRVIWDNAYGVHHIYEEKSIKDIFSTAELYGNEDRIYYFFSTSKITFPGSGVALMAASKKNVLEIKKHLSVQIISYDKVNQLRTVNYFKNADGIRMHMRKLANALKPKFDIVLNTLENEFKGTNLLKWNKPLGGYFVSVDTLEGCAKETVRLSKEAGVILTEAGATYPYGNDPKDSNIRIAPTYPEISELTKAINIFCVCAKLAGVKKLLQKIR